MMRYLFILLCLSLLFTSCGPTYRDDATCNELCDAVGNALGVSDAYAEYERDHVSEMLAHTVSPEDHNICYAKSAGDVGEFGVFRMKDEKQAREMKAVVLAYLDDMRASQGAFLASYAPQELAKLEQAEVHCFGSYVSYAVLEEAQRETFFDTVESLLVT